MIMLNDFLDFIVAAFVACCWRCSCYCCCHHSVVSELIFLSMIFHSAGSFLCSSPHIQFKSLLACITQLKPNKMTLAQIIRQFVFRVVLCRSEHAWPPFLFSFCFVRFNSNDLLEWSCRSLWIKQQLTEINDHRLFRLPDTQPKWNKTNKKKWAT